MASGSCHGLSSMHMDQPGKYSIVLRDRMTAEPHEQKNGSNYLTDLSAIAYVSPGFMISNYVGLNSTAVSGIMNKISRE